MSAATQESDVEPLHQDPDDLPHSHGMVEHLDEQGTTIWLCKYCRPHELGMGILTRQDTTPEEQGYDPRSPDGGPKCEGCGVTWGKPRPPGFMDDPD